MKNPFKKDDDDNPVVPNVIERPAERAAARAQTRDNPLVPNAIEQPAERAVADDVGVVAHRPGTVDRPGINDGPNDRPGVRDTPADLARGRAVAGTPAVDRPFVHDGPGDRPGVMDRPSDISRGAATGTTATGPAASRPSLTDEPHHMDLFPEQELSKYRTQWESIQTGFVDEPRGAVQQADALVSEMASRLTELFTRERSTLESQWSKGDNVSTEDLRIALKRYRSFFHRLLSM